MSLRRIGLLVWKEFLQLRRDRLLLALLFAMPIGQLIFFGYVVAADVRNIATAVVDLDRSVASRHLTDSFAASGYFSLVAHPDGEDAIRPLLDRGDVKAALVIPAGLEASLARGEAVAVGIVVDGSDSKIAAVASGYAAQVVADANAARLREAGLPLDVPGIDASVRVVFNPTLAAVNTMIPGLIATILMISMMAIMSQAVVRERERGTLEQMFVTPITRGEYLTGKVLPYALLAVAQATLVALVGVFWFGVPFAGQVGVAALGLGLFMLTAIGLGLLVSLVSQTRQQAQQTVMFVMIPTMVLAGFIFPIESMPAEVVPLTYVIPLRYAIEVLRGVFIKGTGIEPLAAPLAALLAFSVVIFWVAVLATRKRLSE